MSPRLLNTTLQACSLSAMVCGGRRWHVILCAEHYCRSLDLQRRAKADSSPQKPRITSTLRRFICAGLPDRGGGIRPEKYRNPAGGEGGFCTKLFGELLFFKLCGAAISSRSTATRGSRIVR